MRRVFGRDRERAAIDAVVRSLATGTEASRCLILVGEAGIGKTTLAHVAMATAATCGITSLATAGVALTIGRPLHPILDAFARLDDDVGTGHHDAATRTLLEATVGDHVSLLLQRVIDRLDLMARDEPLLLLVEDLHWVDETTLTLLHHHLTRFDRPSLAIVATSRPPAPGTPLYQLLAAAGPAAMEVGGLDPDAVDELVAVTAGDSEHAVDGRALGAAQGNPLLVEAVVRHHLAQGSVGATTHVLDGGDPVATIVRSVPPDVGSLLQIAAVVGDRLRIDVLAAIGGLAVPEVLDRLDRARTAGVIDVAGDGFVFRHALYRSAVLDAVPATARAAFHLEIARVLELVGAPTLEIAEHVAQGAQPGNRVAVEQLSTAAEEVADIDPSTALRITDLALALVGTNTVPLRLQVVRVACLAACGRAAEADVAGTNLLRSTAGGGIGPEVEAKVRRELALAAFVAGRPADAESHMSRVVDLATTREAAARAVTEQAWARMLSLDRDGAWEGTHAGVRDGDAATRISAESLRCWLAMWRLDTKAAVEAANHVEIAVRLRPRGDWQIFQPLLGAAAVRLELEQYDRTVANIDAGRRLAIDAGSSWAASSYDALTASASFRQGDFDLANSQALAALDGTAIVDSFGVEIWSRSLLAQIALRRNHVQLARHHIDAAALAAEDGRAQLGLDYLFVAQSAMCLADGDPAAALTTLHEGWLFLGAVGIHFVRGIVGVELVKQWCASGEPPEDAFVVASDIDHDARTSGLPLLVSAAARARAWLEPTAAHVSAAVDAAMASQNLIARVDTLTDARLLAPHHPAADTWTTELSRLLARMGCEVVGTKVGAHARAPRGARPLVGPQALTDAERRVALLVAEGFTNAKIAAQLVVSRRTIDTQVLAAYRKLGVSSRVGLTRALLDAES